MIPEHYKEAHQGFWDEDEFLLSKSAVNTLPVVSDYYLECLHFAKLAISLPPTIYNQNKVNWYSGAHLVAYIGAIDAIKIDMPKLDIDLNFKKTPLGKEFLAYEDSKDPLYKDPINSSHFYRVKRNKKVHNGESIIVLEERDFFIKGVHFYFKEIDLKQYKEGKHAPASEKQLKKYNGYTHMETIIDVFGKQIGILNENIEQTVDVIKNFNK